MGEMSMVNPVICLLYFHFFEALNDAIEVLFSRVSLHYYT